MLLLFTAIHGALYEVVWPHLESPGTNTSPLEDTPSFHSVPLQVLISLYYSHMLSAQLLS